IPNAQRDTLRGVVYRHVAPGSTVSTDEWGAYKLLGPEGYQHGAVNHSRKEWARDDGGVLHHTNNVENFWRLFKASIRSTHVHVSSKYMDAYLKEFTFRSNHREMINGMFDLLI